MMIESSSQQIYKIFSKAFFISLFFGVCSCTTILEKITKANNQDDIYEQRPYQPPTRYVPVPAPYYAPNSRVYSNPYSPPPTYYPQYDSDQYYVPPKQYYYKTEPENEIKVNRPY